MHNRARLVVGSFLTKDLGIDWRLGERWFMRLLIDGDEANNNGNWQWIASVGVDPQPHFRRIYNPARHMERFDPEGRYVRRYVPELEDVPDEYLAEPWTMPGEVQEDCGVRDRRATTPSRSSTTATRASARWSATARLRRLTRRRTPTRRAASRRAALRCARRDQQVVEDRRRHPRLEHALVDRLQRQVAVVGVLEPADAGSGRGSAVDSSVRLAQPNQPATSSSPDTRTSSKPAPRGEAGEVAGRERVHVDDVLERVLLRLVAGRRISTRWPDAHEPAPQRARRASAARFGYVRQPVAVVRRLAGEREHAARLEHAPELAERRRRGRAGGAGSRGRRRGRTSRPGTAAARPRVQTVSTVEPEPRGRCRRARRACPARCRWRRPCATMPGLQQVEREVAGAGADLERALVRARAALPSALRSLPVTCAWPCVARRRCPTWSRSRGAATSW